MECASEPYAEPSTLIRAARDFRESDPPFSAQVVLCAIENLLAGGGYEPTTLDMVQAFDHLMAAAKQIEQSVWATGEVKKLVARGAAVGRQDLLGALESRL